MDKIREFMLGDEASLEVPFLVAGEEENSLVSDGQLAIDVLQTSEEVLVVSSMAGALPENISLHLTNDVLTIRGVRESPLPSATEYFCKECYWGAFSRTIVLPVEVQGDLVKAEYKYGVLIIHLPKKNPSGQIQITVVEE